MLHPGSPSSAVKLWVRGWVLRGKAYRNSSAVVECETIKKHVNYLWVLLGQVCSLLGVVLDIEQPKVFGVILGVISRAPKLVGFVRWGCPFSLTYRIIRFILKLEREKITHKPHQKIKVIIFPLKARVELMRSHYISIELYNIKVFLFEIFNDVINQKQIFFLNTNLIYLRFEF